MRTANETLHHLDRLAAAQPDAAFVQAEALSRSGHLPSKAGALSWMAIREAVQGDHRKAITHLLAASTVNDDAQDRDTAKAVWWALGRLHYALGDFETAATVFLDIIAEVDDDDDMLTLAQIQGDLGRCLAHLGDGPRAAVYLRTAMQTLDQHTPNHPARVTTRRNLAAALRQAGRHRNAARWAAEAVALALKTGGSPLVGALSTQARCQLVSGNLRAASDTLDALDALDIRHDILPGARLWLRATLRSREGRPSAGLWSKLYGIERAPSRWREEAAVRLGEMAQKNGNLAEALDWTKAALARRQEEQVARDARTRNTLALRLRLRQARQEADARLRSQQAVERERVGAELVHNLSNLVTVAQVSAEAAQLFDTGPPEDALADVIQATHKASELLRYLRDLAHPQKVALHAVEPDSVLQRMAPLLDRAVGEGVTLQLDLHAPACRFFGPATLFEQAVMNLCLNARDAMSNRGFLHIRTREMDDSVHVVIRDTGPGVNPDMMDQIFEPFFTTKGEHGSGLGLSSVRSFAQRCGGAVELTPHSGPGATFVLTLPIFDDTLDPAPRPRTPELTAERSVAPKSVSAD